MVQLQQAFFKGGVFGLLKQGVSGQQFVAVFYGPLQNVAVLKQIPSLKFQLSALTRAQNFTRAAQLHIPLSYFKAVAGVANNLQPFARHGALVLGVRDYVRKNGLEKALVSLSGGIDSALVLAIAVEALGAHNVQAVLTPSAATSTEALAGARRLAERLSVPVCELPIDALLEGYDEALAPALAGADPTPAVHSKLQELVRGSLLATLASQSSALILNALNKSETALGYCTLYGDTVGSLGVVADLTKTQVQAVARWLNEARDIFPASVLQNASQTRISRQKTGLALPYAELDTVLDALLAAQPRRPLPRIHKRQDEVRDRVFGMEFKRRQEPQPLYVSDKPFGRAWTVPLTGKFNLP